MKTIRALLEVVATDHLRLTEHADDVRMRAPVLSLDSDGDVLAYAPAWGGPKERQRAEQRLMLFKMLIERGLDDVDDEAPAIDVEAMRAKYEVEIARLEGECGGLREKVESLQAENAKIGDTGRLVAALDEILSSDVTSAKRAKEIAAGVRGG